MQILKGAETAEDGVSDVCQSYSCTDSGNWQPSTLLQRSEPDVYSQTGMKGTCSSSYVSFSTTLSPPLWAHPMSSTSTCRASAFTPYSATASSSSSSSSSLFTFLSSSPIPSSSLYTLLAAASSSIPYPAASLRPITKFLDLLPFPPSRLAHWLSESDALVHKSFWTGEDGDGESC